MHSRSWSQRGFGVTELIVVVALIGVMALLGAPSLLSYWRTSGLGAGADELAGVLGRARALAITQNTSVCVQVIGTSVRFLIPNCAGAVFTGTGTDSAGIIRLAGGLQVGGGGGVIFTNTGGANPAGAYTVTSPTYGGVRGVVVATTGRVTIQ
jgi:prepilin-type N-terminal cleavage/methylation domain-containing protein